VTIPNALAELGLSSASVRRCMPAAAAVVTQLGTQLRRTAHSAICSVECVGHLFRRVCWPLNGPAAYRLTCSDSCHWCA
jgi:hypothetical protein